MFCSQNQQFINFFNISSQRDKSMVYAAPTFTQRKTAKAGRRNLETTTEETIYSDIRTFEMESIYDNNISTQ